MFTDPQSVTINAVAKSLVRIETSGRKSVYRDSTGEWTLTISHDEKSRNGRLVKLTQEKVGADPFQTDVNRTYTQSASLVLNHPKVGFTAQETDYLAQGLIDFASDANIDKIIAGES
jgi:hypothetical protein